MIERDYEVFRQFKGRSSLKTYLLVVCTRLLLDWRVERYGKWRPSTAAIRLGEAAVLAERLMYRDGFSINGAFETVRLRFASLDAAELQRIFDLLPQRECRRMVSDQMLRRFAAPPAADPLEALQREGAARRIGDVLQQAVKALPATISGCSATATPKAAPSRRSRRGWASNQGAVPPLRTMLRRLRRTLAEAGVTSPGRSPPAPSNSIAEIPGCHRSARRQSRALSRREHALRAGVAARGRTSSEVCPPDIERKSPGETSPRRTQDETTITYNRPDQEHGQIWILGHPSATIEIIPGNIIQQFSALSAHGAGLLFARVHAARTVEFS